MEGTSKDRPVLLVRDGEIPSELCERPQWITWKSIPNPGGPKPKKIPFDATGEGPGKSNDPTTWSTFDECFAAYQIPSLKLAGVGFVFSTDDPFVGIDLDHCRDPQTGEFAPWALEILTRFRTTYCEVSPSSAGVKLFVRGHWPIDDGKMDPQHKPALNGGDIEVYARTRFFAVTGHKLAEHPAEISECQAALDWLASTYFGHKLNPKPISKPTKNTDAPPIDVAVPALPSGDATVRACMDYLAKLPISVSGDRGSDRAFRAACACFRFGLSDDQARNAFGWYCANRSSPPWSDEREIAHKLADAKAKVASAGEFGELAASSTPWPDPQPLPVELPSVEAFDFALLPEVLGPWIMDIAERMQCPPDFPAVGAMVALAGVVGRSVGVRPKRCDDWTVVANLWGIVVGRPSIMKTPAIEQAIRPLRRLEAEAREQFNAELQQYRAAALVHEATIAVAKKNVAGAVKAGKGDALNFATTALAESPDPPVRRRYLVNDVTVEQLGVILNANPKGVTVFRDEMVGLWRKLDKEGNETDRAFYLESWNGNGRFTYDRVGRGNTEVDSNTLSLLGGVQPGPLQDYIRAAIRGGAGDDGFVQRFQLAVWPDVPKHWRNVDEWPDCDAKNTAFEVFRRLDAIDVDAIGAERDDDDLGDGIPFLRFDEPAQARFDRYRDQLENRLRTEPMPPALESALAKYRSLVPSLALLIHLADVGHGPIGAVSIGKAIGWANYLWSHAQRIYNAASRPAVRPALALAAKIESGEIDDGAAVRGIYRNGWSSLSDREDVEHAVALLERLGWVREHEIKTDGRSRKVLWINPQIGKGAPK